MDTRAQAHLFFETLFSPSDAIETRPIDPSGDADVVRGRWWPASFDEAVRLAFRHSELGWNAYYGTFPRVGRELALSGAESVSAMTSAWVEIDWVKLVPGGDQAIRSGGRSLEDVMAEGKGHADSLLAALPIPTIAVASGAGYHVYWALAARLPLVTADARAQAEALLRAANARAGGDKTVHDLARVLRVPGTVNWPNRRKRALGRGPAPTSLIHLNADARYTIDELISAFGAPESNGDVTTTAIPETGATVGPPSDGDLALLHSNAKLLKIWNGLPLEGDRSRRDSRFALAGLRAGIAPGVIERLLLSMPNSKAAVSKNGYLRSVMRWAHAETDRAPMALLEPAPADVAPPSSAVLAGPATLPVPATSPTVGVAGPEPWEPPIPLDQRRDVEGFPDVLPEPFRSYAVAVASYTSTPLDISGGLALVAIASSVLGKYHVAARWREPLNVFFAAIAEPGERKSPVFRAMFRPLRAFEAARRVERAPEIERERSLRRALERRRERLEKDLAQAEGMAAREDAERRLGDVHRDLAAHPEPVEPRLLVDDATPEALAGMLAEHGGLALLSTEGGVFSQMRGRYSKAGANLDTYNKAFDGDSLSTDRVGGGVLRADAPSLVIGVTVQPALVRDLAQERALRDLGLLGRFLFSWPRSLVGSRVDGPPVPDQVERSYADAVTALLSLGRDTMPLELAPDASTALDDYRAQLERELRPGGRSADIADWANKLPGKVMRLAALLHLAANAPAGGPIPRTITAATLDGAVRLGRYFASHARAVLGLLGTDAALGDAQVVLAKLREAGRATIKRSDLYELAPGRLKRKADVDAVLALLVDRRVLRPVETFALSGRGRPPATFEVNPTLLPGEDREWGEWGK